jgi:hypothetical protein
MSQAELSFCNWYIVDNVEKYSIALWDLLLQHLFCQILPRPLGFCHFACHSAKPVAKLAEFCQPNYQHWKEQEKEENQDNFE